MKSLNQNERGVVSMIVSVTIMIIISLVIISFARLMRTEQEQALDRQLSAQAFYAAEAAINDARKAFFEGAIQDSTQCTTGAGQPLSETQISDDSVSKYTCVTIDSTPSELVYDSIGTDRSTVIEVRAFDDAGDPQRVEEIVIAWEDSGGSTDFASGGSTELPSKVAWGSRPGILRLEIIPLPFNGYDRDYLSDNTQTVFLYPSTTQESYAWAGSQSDQGQIIGGGCTAVIDPAAASGRYRHCQVTIGSLPLIAGDSYLLRMRSIYKETSVTISAGLDGGGEASFGDAQVVIDATGKSANVLRRVRERLPLSFSYDFPEFTLDIADDLCKRLVVEADGSVSTDQPNVSACQK